MSSDFGTLGKLAISLEANIATFQSDLGRASQVAEDAMAKISRSAEIAKVALGGIGVALSISGFSEMIMKTVEQTAALKEMAAKSGATVESLSAMRKVAKESGTDMESVVTGMQKLAKNMVAAQEGTGKAADAFQKFGLRVTDSQGHLKGTGQMLFELAQHMNEYGDGAGKTTGQQELLGKSGANLADFLEKLGERQSLVATRTTEQAEQAEKLQIALVRIGAQVEEFKASLVLGMLPALEKSIPLFKLAATVGAEFFATFIVGPKLVAAGVVAFEAAAIAMRALSTQLAIAQLAVLSGVPAWTILNTTLWGTGLAAEFASGMLGKLKIGFGVLFAAVAGWQIGTYLREQFVEVDLAGIALVEGLAKAWEWMKYGFTVAVESMKSLFYGFISGVGGALSHVPGFGAAAATLSKTGAAGSRQSSLAIAQAAAERNRNIASNAEIFGEMADEAIERHQGAAGEGAKKGNKPITTGLGDGAIEALRKQIEGRIQMLDRANASEKLLMSERQATLQYYYQTDQLSLYDYYAGRKIAQDAALAQTVDNFNKEISAWQAYQGHYKQNSKEYIDAANKIAEIRDKISTAEQENSKQSITDWQQQQQAIKAFADKLTDLRAKLADMRGNKGAAAGIQFDLGNQSFVNQLTAIANSTTASVDKIMEARQALANIAELRSRAIENAATDFQSGASRAFRTYAEEAGNAAASASKLFTKAFQGMEDALVNFVKTGKLDFRSLADSIVADITRMQIQASITEPLARSLSGGGGIFGQFIGALGFGGGTQAPAPVVNLDRIASFGGGRASGGSVDASKFYLVGENGPELFAPGQSGKIIPSSNNFSSGNGNSGSPMNITLNITTPDANSFRRSSGQITAQMSALLQQARRNM